MSGQVFAIAHHAFMESLRQQIFAVLLLLVGGLLALHPPLSRFTLGEDDKLLVDLGLSTLLLGTLVLAAFTAACVLGRELEDGTVLTVITKPVSRTALIVGKFLGIAAAVSVALWVWGLVYLLTLRHGVLEHIDQPLDQPVLAGGFGALLVALSVAVGANYFLHKPFGGTLALSLAFLLPIAYGFVLAFDRRWNRQALTTDLDTQVLAALLLVAEGAWLFSAVAVCAATRLGQVATLAVCVLVFLVGLSSDYALGGFDDSSTLAHWARAAIPNMQYLWVADALTQGYTVEARYLGLVSAYAALLITGTLALAVALFRGETPR